MSTRGYLLFRSRWNGPLTAYYQHHDAYPTGLGADVIEALRILEYFREELTAERVVKHLNEIGYNLRRSQRSFSNPEQVFQYQGDIEWIYVVTAEDAPEHTRLEIFRTSNPYTDTPFCFKAWSSRLRFFPTTHETPKEMHTLEMSTNITLNAIVAYEEATIREKQKVPQLQAQHS